MGWTNNILIRFVNALPYSPMRLNDDIGTFPDIPTILGLAIKVGVRLAENCASILGRIEINSLAQGILHVIAFPVEPALLCICVHWPLPNCHHPATFTLLGGEKCRLRTYFIWSIRGG